MIKPYAFASAILLEKQMFQRGYTADTFEISHRTFTTYSKPGYRDWTTLRAGLHYPFMQPSIEFMAKQKQLMYAYAQNQDVVIPATYTTEDYDDTLMAFMHEHGTVIVKPNNSHSSHGLTINVSTDEALEVAFKLAKAWSTTVVVQKQFFGEEMRFTIVNGKVRSALQRQKPRVIGDGQRTISELINAENAERSKLHFDYATYPQLAPPFISSDIAQSTHVPQANEVVELSKMTMINDGASMYELLDEVHPSYIALAEHLVTKLDPQLLAIDFMIVDHTVPASNDNYVFLEMNTCPSLRMYYCCRNGKTYDIIPDIISLLETWGKL